MNLERVLQRLEVVSSQTSSATPKLLLPFAHVRMQQDTMAFASFKDLRRVCHTTTQPKADLRIFVPVAQARL